MPARVTERRRISPSSDCSSWGTNLDIVQVPFQGGGAAVMSTLAGHTQILHITLPLVAGHIQEGKLRGLAVADTKRSSLVPDVPTLNEAGIAKHEVGYWTGIMVPAATPDRIVSLLNQAVGKVMSSSRRQGAAWQRSASIRCLARPRVSLITSVRSRRNGAG